MLSTLVRRFLPAGLKIRYFARMIHKSRLRLKISLRDIAKGVEYHPEEEGIQADHFLVIARKGK